MAYTNVFTGSTIYPAEVSLTKLDLTENVHLYWPLEANPDVPLASRIVQISSATAGNLVIYLPSAIKASVGETILFNNLSTYTVIVSNFSGVQQITIPPATEWQIYLATNTTDDGTWKSYQFGATTSTVNASSLQGPGIKADGSTLEQSIPQHNFTTNTVLTSSARASFYNWEGAAGTLTLPAAAVVGNDWFVHVRNSGTGDLTVLPDSIELINEVASLALSPGDSATFITDGTDFYTIGLGQSATFAFDYVVINVTGSSNYTLTGTELNRIAYQFTGTMGADFTVIVPNTTQQYWVYNNTSGGYNLSIGTAAQASPLLMANSYRTIVYCDGTNVVPAVTTFITGSISGGTF